MKIGIQLFGVLKDRQEKPAEALEMLRELGYSRIEPCISLQPIPGLDHVVWSLDWLDAHGEEIRGIGLEMVSCHLFAENPGAERLQRIAAHGIRQFIVKSPQTLTEETLQEAARSYMRLADLLADMDAELLIHNEAQDITTKFSGKTAYETLLDLCEGKAGAQVDVGWVFAGGDDPETLLRRNAGRVKSLHFKDFLRQDGQLVETAVGSGIVDTAACFRFACEHGCVAVADVDRYPTGQREDLRTTCETLTGLAEAFKKR